MEIFFIVIISYLLGSIPFGYLLTKFFLKKDIRKIGSGNIGATNALRTGNKTLGYFTLIFDISKAVVPVLVIKNYFQEYIYISSLCVFLGHIFPIWLKFKGGKGVATYVGILFCINYLIGLAFISTWLVIYLIFKFSSLSSMVSSLFVPIYYYYYYENQNYYFYIIMFILIFFTHRENIKRLINKTESKTKIY